MENLKFRMENILHFALCIALALASCGGADMSKKKVATTSNSEVTMLYTPPSPPILLASDKERLAFVVENYWDNFDFRDSTMLRPQIAEQAFADYMSVVVNAPIEKAKGAMVKMMRSASVDSLALHTFIEITDRYLYDPNSPFLNEELYIPILKYIVSSDKLDNIYKVRPRYQLSMAMKNRVGSVATDFTITLRNGKLMCLSDVDSEYTILYFNNPDCSDCERVYEILSTAEVFAKNKSLKIVALYIDKDLELWKNKQYPSTWINGVCHEIDSQQTYDLKAIPTLYLLDKDKRVLLKDATVEAIGEFLM